MSELQPCGECRRHVSISESVCPFCGAARDASAAGSLTFRRVSRAAVFAGAALASTACGGNKPKAEPIDNQQQSAQVDAGTAPQLDPNDPNHPNNPHNIPMPYGAPPARRRVV